MPIRKTRNPRSFEKCRACRHSFISHTDLKNLPDVCLFILEGGCKCKEFLPEDNLEFLEYKAQKRNK
jgi:hypothetical protein